MIKRIQFAVQYLSEDGKYLGGVHGEEFEKGAKTSLKIPDNGGLEHILEATVVESTATKEGKYSLLLELNPRAP